MPLPKLPGQLITKPNAADVAKDAAARLAQCLRDAIGTRGRASLALSGGNTPRPAYEQLAKEPGIDWSKVSVYWIDERAVPPDHERSNYRLAHESLLSRAPIPPSQVHRMVGEASSLEQAAKDYEALLVEQLPKVNDVPVIDVAVLGIGDDGHTASLFPGEGTVNERQRRVLAIAASPANAREARLTVTAPVIQQISTVLVLAVGAAKRAPLEHIASDTGSLVATPSRLLRDVTGSLLWIVDVAAVSV